MHYLLIPYSLIAILFMFFYTKKNENIFRFGIAFLLSISIILLGIGIIFQPLYGDAYSYSLGLKKMIGLDFFQMNSLTNPAYGFRFISWISIQITDDVKFFFVLLYTLYIFITFKALKNLYNNFEKYIVFSFLILYPYFIFYIASAKKQGIALVLMLLAISYIFSNERIKVLIFLFLSYLFHSAMVLTYPVFLFFIFFRNNKKLFVLSVSILFIAILSSVLKLNEQLSLLASIFDINTRYLAYFDDSFSKISYRTGFRLDFTIFSLFPLFLYVYFRNHISNKEKVIQWLSLYLLLNSIYHFFSFIVYSDRIAIFSWFILPIVCYEILKNINNGKYLQLFIFGLIFINVLLLQLYSGNTLHELEILQ